MRPGRIFLTRGIGRGHHQLLAFEMALRDAGISQYNLVRVSSILPPNCEIIEKEEGIKRLEPGSIVFLVLARNESNEKGKQIAASIGMAVPEDRNHYGYLSEYESSGEDENTAGENAKKLAIEMLSSLLDKEHRRMKIFGNSISASAVVGEEWTCVVSAAVFVP